ncbi:hypothetical protein LJC10_02940, partial [Selenomonadales bacterium OttesenSCG-928-I06]|nr:hypothetical protein [Selenomonadales bacterium OttesenSCG-928-I06]
IKENYLNSPYDYLKNISDDYYLELYRKANIIICTGQGAWEDLMIEETLLIKEELKRKRIPAWIDFWGKEVEHDWHWWKLQMVYFLNHILYDEDNKIRKVNSL